MTAHDLTGLDGSNPLGYLAALGTLAVVHERCDGAPTLRWDMRGRWRPTLECPLGREALIAALIADVPTWRESVALSLEYRKSESAPDGATVRDLKPPPERWRAFVQRAIAADRFALDLIAGLACEGGLDRGGMTKPTALHFTAGQQRFLEMALGIATSLEPSHFEEALFGPWRYQSALPVLGWDVANDRMYAYRATDPSSDKKAGIPGADWLALLGLSLLPVFARRGKAVTTACRGSWKRGQLVWPLWDGSLPYPVVRTVVALPVDRLSVEERQARGIRQVLSAAIRRSDQGGYGSFSPARALA